MHRSSLLSESARGGGVGGLRRGWACLLAVVLVLSFVPGTAVAQQDSTPPSVTSVVVFDHTNYETRLLVRFDEVVIDANSLQFGVTTDDGTARTVSGPQITLDGLGVSLNVRPIIPENAVILVSFSQVEGSSWRLKDAAGNEVEAFRWNVSTNMQIPTVAEVYEALKSYFSGTVTLSEVEGVLSGDDQTYHEKLLEQAAAGELHERLPAGERTTWGTDGSSGWVQVGTPSLPPGPSHTCGGETVPELTGDDRGKFFWACSQDNRWVPVRLPQAGVDYARDEHLVRPPAVPGSDPNYNEKCRYTDEDGNPQPVSKYDPKTDTFTWIQGGNWDPTAEECTGRGNP